MFVAIGLKQHNSEYFGGDSKIIISTLERYVIHFP
jgi:hypothetical protein